MAHDLDPAVLEQLETRVSSHAGLKVPTWVLASRVQTRMAALGIDDAAAYLEVLADAEMDRLVEALRVGETRFFRHRSAMAALVDIVVPALREGTRPVRAWSAGCATGEEAYSLAILLRQHIPSPRKVQVTGTDISAAALEVAAAGHYPDDALAHVPADMRDAFERSGDAWRVVEDYASLVTFERANLAEARFPRHLDVILCRNVLIYFEPEARRRTVERLIDSLVTGGFLCVGYSETLRDFPALEAMRTSDFVVYRKRDGVNLSTYVPQPRAKTEPGVAPARPAIAPPRVVAPSSGTKVDKLTPSPARVVLRGRYDDGARLREELAAVMGGDVVVDADGAEYLGDAAAAVLRRARAAARAAGATFRVRATRPGTQRWLRRSGLGEDDA